MDKTGGARYLTAAIADDALASGKMAFISGPRQVGKTTLAKQFLRVPQNYLTWDDASFRRAWSRKPLDAIAGVGPGPLVLDEVHKDRRWKTRLKGLYDIRGAGDGILVTGSARLDLYRRGGDSLLGRYIPYRLHPFSVGEASAPSEPDAVFSARKARFSVADLLKLGGFPEPLLGGHEGRAKRWSRLRVERLLHEDVRDLRAISDLAGLQVLADLLPERVGSLLSVNALQQDVGAAYATVRAWLQVFEALYHSFSVRPYTRRITRTLRAAPKLYLFDLLAIPADKPSARLENLVALHLLKACHYWTDTAQGEFDLHYVRTKEGHEVDFLVVRDRAPWLLVECKTSDLEPSTNLQRFGRMLRVERLYQLVHKPGYARHYTQSNVHVLDYERFLSAWV